MRPRFDNALPQYATSIQVQRNVRRLLISKSLTCDDLNEALTFTPVSAMTRSRRFGYVCGALATLGRTFWQYCARGNGKQALIDNRMRSPT